MLGLNVCQLINDEKVYEFLSFRSVVDPSQRENLGIIVQYKVKVKLCLGALGG